MPLTEIRRFADLIRRGPGNEHERLALLRRHERHVMAQIAELQDCLAVISGKVATYQQHVAGEILFRQQDGRWLLRC